MKEDSVFIVPDIWQTFMCKCGDCRRSCCEGWNISISEDEYFRLIGMDCPMEIRRKLDEAFSIPHDACPERYALLNHNYLGECPLRAENGLCALQHELGEDAIPSVCRLYPRAIDRALGEATLSNSCEAVAESFLAHAAPLTFIPITLHEHADGHMDEARLAIRRRCTELMQDRRTAVHCRIASVGEFLGIEKSAHVSFEKRFSMLVELAELYGEISPSISDCCTEALKQYAACGETRFTQLALAYDERFERAERLMEHTLVNHMFYEKFPFTAQADCPADAFFALCGTYGFLRFICIGNDRLITDGNALVDIVCAMFRMIEHTRFDHNVCAVLSRFGEPRDVAAGLLEL